VQSPFDVQTNVKSTIFAELKEVRKGYPNQFLCYYLNINSLRYKCCSIKELLTTNTVDMLIIGETKLDDTFINGQFEVDNYHLWRADRNPRGGGLLMYIRSDLERATLNAGQWILYLLSSTSKTRNG